MQLWTSEYAEGEIRGARRVTTVEGHRQGSLGDGYFVHPERDPDDASHALFAIYRVSDGARATANPSSLDANRVLYVSDDTLIVEAFGQIYRIDPRSLTFEGP